MSEDPDFISKLETKLSTQLRSQRVGFLVGAGSSYLDGDGYPLAFQLWDSIKNLISNDETRNAIQQKLDNGAEGIEQALDLLDDGGAEDTSYRHEVTKVIAEHFASIEAPLTLHRRFVSCISKRNDPSVKIFSLNYDPLIERAAELEHVRITDGFIGHENAFFNRAVFEESYFKLRGPRAKPTIHPAGVPIHLYKLHGSLGWYDCPERGVCRCGFRLAPPSGATRLMVPPQRRKASDVVTAPYSPLWTAFRGALSQDSHPLNRLVTLGYGFADEHVNDVIEGALVRDDFTLLIMTKALSDSAWQRWSVKANVVIITEDRCALNSLQGPGHQSLWSLEKIVEDLL